LIGAREKKMLGKFHLPAAGAISHLRNVSWEVFERFSARFSKRSRKNSPCMNTIDWVSYILSRCNSYRECDEQNYCCICV